MTVLAGQRWRDGAAKAAWVRVQDDRVVASGDGTPSGPTRPVLLLDGLVDAHTHVGDAFLAGHRLPRDLQALVAPGTGYKHRMLAQASDDQIVKAMRRHLEALARAGVERALDFREQGVRGVRLAQEAVRMAQGAPTMELLGRPDPWNGPADIDAILAAADGIGWPSASDGAKERLQELSKRCHGALKPFALHLSEGKREPIEDVLALHPSLLIHACQSTHADLQRVAQAKVPLVLCPTSNQFFGLKSPDPRTLDRLGVPWHLGTDNAMLGGIDLLDEVRQLIAWYPGVPDASLARALTSTPWKPLKSASSPSPAAAPRRLTVLPLGAEGAVRWDAAAQRLAL